MDIKTWKLHLVREGMPMRFVVEGSRPTSERVTDDIRKYYPATVREASEGYGRIIALQDGKPPFTLCSFLLDMEAEDVLTLFWVKMKEHFPKEAKSL